MPRALHPRAANVPGQVQEAARLRNLLGADLPAIEHVGSTSVPGLAEMGYDRRTDASGPERILFARGPETKRTHYLHVCELGSSYWSELASSHADDRETYTARKAAFIADVLRRAVTE